MTNTSPDSQSERAGELAREKEIKKKKTKAQREGGTEILPRGAKREDLDKRQAGMVAAG